MAVLGIAALVGFIDRVSREIEMLQLRLGR